LGKIIKIVYFILISAKYYNENIIDARLQIPITVSMRNDPLAKIETIDNSLLENL